MLQRIRFCAEKTKFCLKAFKIDTLQPLVAPVRHQKLHFLNKNSEVKHFSKIISFKKSKFWASAPTKHNRLLKNFSHHIRTFFVKPKNSSSSPINKSLSTFDGDFVNCFSPFTTICSYRFNMPSSLSPIFFRFFVKPSPFRSFSCLFPFLHSLPNQLFQAVICS